MSIEANETQSKALSPADIATPLLGPVLRVQRNLLVGSEAPDTSHYPRSGEWPSMTYANWLLDARFGQRDRPYLVHQAKTISRPLLSEVASIWAEELQSTASSRFRGQGSEVNTLFLATHYIFERHREALLWSYFVARMDSSGTGKYNQKDRLAILKDFRNAPNVLPVDSSGFRVYQPGRKSLIGNRSHELLNVGGLAGPIKTVYQFSSMDGYALSSLGRGSNGWPTFETGDDNARPRSLTLGVARCFGGIDYGAKRYTGDSTSAGLFRRMAYEQPECGDIVIAILLGKSGACGLEAFLPAPASSMDGSHTHASLKLPGMYSKTWYAADVSLASVLAGGWTARDYAVRLIQRYSYVIGDTDSKLVMMRSSLQTLYDLRDLGNNIKDGKGPVSSDESLIVDRSSRLNPRLW